MSYATEMADYHRAGRIADQAARRANAHALIRAALEEAITVAAESREAFGIEMDEGSDLTDALHWWLTNNPASLGDDEPDPMGDQG